MINQSRSQSDEEGLDLRFQATCSSSIEAASIRPTLKVSQVMKVALMEGTEPSILAIWVDFTISSKAQLAIGYHWELDQ